MQRVKITVAYEDGHTDEVIVRPVAVVAAERHFKGNTPPFEGTLFLAYYMLKPEQTFADWLESVENVAEEAVPPSSAMPSSASPTSPSNQE